MIHQHRFQGKFIESLRRSVSADLDKRDQASDEAVFWINSKRWNAFGQPTRFARLLAMRARAGIGLSPAEYAAAFFPGE